MGVRILHDVQEQQACLYDSVTGTVFGPIIGPLEATDETLNAGEAADAFAEWVAAGEDGEYAGEDLTLRVSNAGSPGADPRRIMPNELAELEAQWRKWREGGPAPTVDVLVFKRGVHQR